MARNPEHQSMYDAVSQFKENCLLADRSLLWPERSYWTLDNLSELKQRFIEHDMPTDQTFAEKFLVQLGSDKPVLWGIACDLFFVYSLPSSSMKRQSKINLMTWAATNGNLAMPLADHPIWNALAPGFAHTGIQYHRKVGQIAFMILLAIGIKESSDPQKIFETPETYLDFVNRYFEGAGRSWNRAPDMRSALAYMLYPDFFECIISMRDKQLIANTYQEKFHLALVGDLDQTIYQIRQQLSPIHDKDGKPFHFYTDLKSEWQPRPPKPEPEPTKPPEPEPTEDTEDPDVTHVRELLSHTRNVILYGPPGTGKTYVAKQVAHQLIEKQLGENVSQANRAELAIQDLTLHEVLALDMYRNDPSKKLTVPELEQLPLVQARFRIAPVKYPRQSLWGSLQLHAPSESVTV